MQNEIPCKIVYFYWIWSVIRPYYISAIHLSNLLQRTHKNHKTSLVKPFLIFMGLITHISCILLSSMLYHKLVCVPDWSIQTFNMPELYPQIDSSFPAAYTLRHWYIHVHIFGVWHTSHSQKKAMTQICHSIRGSLSPIVYD